MDLVFLIGSGVGLLAIWIALSSLIMVLRDRFTRDRQTESDPILLAKLRPGGSEGRSMRSSRR